jgi:purine nucleoside phosphorylase
VTNLAAGLGGTKLSHEEVSATGRLVEQRLAGLLKTLVPAVAVVLGG